MRLALFFRSCALDVLGYLYYLLVITLIAAQSMGWVGWLRYSKNNILRALFDSRVVFPFLLLLITLFINHFLVRPIFSELDILEHFLFGFVLSEAASQVAAAAGVEEWLAQGAGRIHVRQLNLLIRFFGFLLIGGLLWESLEYLLLPAFGVPYNPFFALPITLHNIDGMIDVTVGSLGCLLAWYTAKKRGIHRAPRLTA